jgi:DNA-binding winged helix-turn-helix (wHTH) protein
MALTLDDLGKGRESSPSDGYLYRFGQFALDSRKRTVSRADSPISLTPKAFDVLLFLTQNPNRLVTKEELLQAVWGDTFVEEGT